MNYIQFTNINSYYFYNKINKNKILKNYKSLKKILNTIKYFHILRNKQHKINLNLIPRKKITHETKIIIITNPYTKKQIKKFNNIKILLPKTKKIITIYKLPQNLYTPN